MKFEQVSYTYQSKTPFAREGLKHVDLAITEPNMLAIVGQTGSGKSTLVQHLNGLFKPTAGVYSHGAVQLTAPYKKGGLGNLRQKVGLVFQFPEKQLFHETVQKDLVYGPMNFGFSAEEALYHAKKALEQVGLNADFLQRKIDALSGGEKRRVAIASILSACPEVLVLDEPTAGLDPKHKRQMLQMLENLYITQQMTIVWVTHDMDDVLRYAQEMVVMAEGEVKHIGKPTDVFHTVHVEDYGLMKPRVIWFKEQLAKKFGVELPRSVWDLDEVIYQFSEKYQAKEQVGDRE